MYAARDASRWLTQEAAEPLPWPQFCSELLAQYDVSQRAPSTRRGMCDVLDAITKLGIQSTADLTVGLVSRYVASMRQDLAPATKIGRLRYLAVACNWAWKTGMVRVSPFLVKPIGQWVRKSAPTRQIQWHTSEAIGRVLAEMKRQAATRTGFEGWRAKRLLALTSTLAYTGIRASECYWLEVADIDLENRLLHIRPKARHALKTAASEAEAIVPPQLADCLTSWLEHRMDAPEGFPINPTCTWAFPNTYRTGPWVSGSPGCRPRDRMVCVASYVGVEGFNPLSLRHSVGTRLAALGAGPHVIKQALRHSNTRTQNFYVHRDTEALRSFADQIEY
jgi:integrase